MLRASIFGLMGCNPELGWSWGWGGVEVETYGVLEWIIVGSSSESTFCFHRSLISLVWSCLRYPFLVITFDFWVTGQVRFFGILVEPNTGQLSAQWVPPRLAKK